MACIAPAGALCSRAAFGRATPPIPRGWRAAASASGVERLPGAMQKRRTPQRTASSTSSVAQAAFTLGACAGEGARSSSA
jgi:hypothetical protein